MIKSLFYIMDQASLSWAGLSLTPKSRLKPSQNSNPIREWRSDTDFLIPPVSGPGIMCPLSCARASALHSSILVVHARHLPQIITKEQMQSHARLPPSLRARRPRQRICRIGNGQHPHSKITAVLNHFQDKRPLNAEKRKACTQWMTWFRGSTNTAVHR